VISRQRRERGGGRGEALLEVWKKNIQNMWKIIIYLFILKLNTT